MVDASYGRSRVSRSSESVENPSHFIVEAILWFAISVVGWSAFISLIVWVSEGLK